MRGLSGASSERCGGHGPRGAWQSRVCGEGEAAAGPALLTEIPKPLVLLPEHHLGFEAGLWAEMSVLKRAFSPFPGEGKLFISEMTNAL